MLKKILCFLFFVFSVNIPTRGEARVFDADDQFELAIEHARLSTVFIATEYNYFDERFGRGEYPYEYARPVYEWKWPSMHSFGSGFLISPDGYIVTNAHVIEDITALLVIVQNPDYRVCKAKIIGFDMRTDIAVLKLEGVEGVIFPYLKLGDSNQVNVGDEVYAIGNPRTGILEGSVTKGIISGKDRYASRYSPISGLLQTDAALNTGNSGGPLINDEGDVIGVVTSVMSPAKGYVSIGFALPSNALGFIVDQIIKTGVVSQGFLGVELSWYKENAFNTYYFDLNDGALIQKVIPETPAADAGLQRGDKILKVDDAEIRSAKSLRNEIWIRPPNSSVKITVDRDGVVLDLFAKLGGEQFTLTYSSTPWVI